MRNSTEGEKNSREEVEALKASVEARDVLMFDKRTPGDAETTSELVKATQESKVLILSERVANEVGEPEPFSLKSNPSPGDAREDANIMRAT